jgi:dCMP deaminase
VRPTRDEWAMALAMVTAKRATCLRRQVGCVLLNARGHVMATGYNGVAAGQPHCNEKKVYHEVVTYSHACLGATAPSGQGLDACQAIHAEQNALLQCTDPWSIDACYVTASPCVTCVKLLMNTSCQRIVFAEPYPHSDAELWWIRAGRKWEHLGTES